MLPCNVKSELSLEIECVIHNEPRTNWYKNRWRGFDDLPRLDDDWSVFFDVTRHLLFLT